MKIRIFALSKELDIDSKELIQHCIDAGLDVKSSALASITPEERDVLMAHLAKVRGGSSAAKPIVEIAAPKAIDRPMRPREIRELAPPPITRRPPPRKESAVEPVEPVAPPEIVVEVAAPELPAAQPAVDPGAPVRPTSPTSKPIIRDVPVRPAAMGPLGKPPVLPTKSTGAAGSGGGSKAPLTPAKPPIAAPKAPMLPPKVQAPVEPPPLKPEIPLTRSPAVVPPAPTVVAAEDDAVAPMSRDDSGNRGLGGIREMQARGNVRDADGRAAARRKEREKRGPALPTLAAAPNFQLAKPAKKHEGPVQKPDLALTGEVLRNNKLSEIIKKRDEATKRPELDEEDVPGRAPRAGSLSLEEARAQRRRGRQRKRGPEDEENVIVKSHKRHRRNANSELKSEATVDSPVTVRTLSEATGRPAKDIQSILFKTAGMMATMNDSLDDDMAMEVAMELGVALTIARQSDYEDELNARYERDEFDAPMLPRPPIITILGHVDHGKTTLVDTIRSANVAATEAGGITQHIAAYQVEHNGQRLTFVDTPGHAAFGEMRARGANVTDIIVLVVAADDGVMPQTVECIAHAKAAGVPIVVAMNKIDLPAANEQKVLTDLSHHGILPQEWGGDVEVIRVSALKKTGIDTLLETLLLTAEIEDLRSPVDLPAEGVCLEAFLDEGRGPIAWAIVRRGILRVGDIMLCGNAIGRVRAMYNERDEEIAEAGPSTPVRIAGLEDVPGAGDQFFIMPSVEEARDVAEERQLRRRQEALARRSSLVSLEEFFTIRDGKLKDLPLIIKADTPGSIEAIRMELERFEHDEVRIKILHEAVGGVNESDIYLAASAGAIIIAFHVIAEDRAESLAIQEGVDIRRYSIIYNVTAEIRQALEGLLAPEKVEVSTGRALVLRTFAVSRTGTVAGCRVLNGTIERNNRVHIIRDQKIINDYAIASLRREKDDAREVREGYECGIRLDGFNDVKEGDLLEAFRVEERKRSLDD